MGNSLSLAISIAVPVGAGFLIGISTQKEVKGWYKKIKKPRWNPPNWLFGPVWTAMYTLMGVASWMVWKEGGGAVPLTLYGIQLVLNLAWNPIFFKKHDLGLALVDITALVGVLVATIVKFNDVSPTAAGLMLPYLGWVSFATALTADIYQRNQSKGPDNEVQAQSLPNTKDL